MPKNSPIQVYLLLLLGGYRRTPRPLHGESASTTTQPQPHLLLQNPAGYIRSLQLFITQKHEMPKYIFINIYNVIS